MGDKGDSTPKRCHVVVHGMFDRPRPLLLLATLALPSLGLALVALHGPTPSPAHAQTGARMAMASEEGLTPANGDFSLVVDEILAGPFQARSQLANCLIITTNGTTSIRGGFLGIRRADPVAIPEEIPRPLELLIGAPDVPAATTTGALPLATNAPAFDLWRGIEARFLVRAPAGDLRVAVRESLTMSVAFVTEGDPLVYRVGGCA